MKYLLILLWLAISLPLSAQQVAVVNVDSVEVKSQSDESSETIDIIYRGTEVQYVQTVGSWVVRKNGGGFVPVTSLIGKKAFINKGGVIRSSNPFDMPPESFTEKEIAWLMLQDQRDHNEQMRIIERGKTAATVVGVLALTAIVIELAVMISDNRKWEDKFNTLSFQIAF